MVFLVEIDDKEFKEDDKALELEVALEDAGFESAKVKSYTFQFGKNKKIQGERNEHA